MNSRFAPTELMILAMEMIYKRYAPNGARKIYLCDFHLDSCNDDIEDSCNHYHNIYTPDPIIEAKLL